VNANAREGFSTTSARSSVYETVEENRRTHHRYKEGSEATFLASIMRSLLDTSTDLLSCRISLTER
jgi:hypothetical protein